jgi:hypothetical protein
MKRTAAITIATAALSLAMSLATTGAAHADPDPSDVGCGGGYVAPALSTHLHYRAALWNVGADPDAGTLGIAAPRGWSFVRTPEGEGRFHNRAGTALLSLRPAARPGTTAELMAAQVRALAGTSGLKVVGQHTTVMRNLDQVWSTLAYRYLSSMSEPRTVKVRWIGFGTDAGADASVVLTVAGRPLDGKGLDTLLGHVTPTVRLAG